MNTAFLCTEHYRVGNMRPTLAGGKKISNAKLIKRRISRHSGVVVGSPWKYS